MSSPAHQNGFLGEGIMEREAEGREKRVPTVALELM